MRFLKEVLMICPCCHSWRICQLSIHPPDSDPVVGGDRAFLHALANYPTATIISCRELDQ